MIWHTVLGLLLMAVPVGTLYYFDRQLLRSFGAAVVRMAVQLLALSLVVWALVKYDVLWLNLLWLVLLSVASAFFAVRRVKLPFGRYLLPVSGGLLAGALLVGLYLLLVALSGNGGLGARWFVPVMALLVGHSATMTIRGLSAYLSAFQADRTQYEFLRGNGSSHLQAVLPFVRRALQAIMAPTVANLSVMGLFTMPLLLCGILLGGLPPITAFALTLLMVAGCLASQTVSLIVSLWLAERE